MSVSAIQNYSDTTAAAAASTAANSKPAAEESASTAKESTASSTGFSNTAAVYEKTSEKEESSSKTSSATKGDRSAIIQKLKADAEQRTSQLRDIVQKMMTQQGQTIGNADSMWSFLAKGNFTVSADVKAQAQADIADDGYWGVNQTSDRILDFAKALAGDDPEKADEMLEAFKKGFKLATKSWGKDLPDISKRTYEAVEKKFDEWKKSANKTDEAADAQKASEVAASTGVTA